MSFPRKRRVEENLGIIPKSKKRREAELLNKTKPITNYFNVLEKNLCTKDEL